MADYKFDGTTLRAKSGTQQGKLEGTRIRAANGSPAGTIDGKYVKDARGLRIGQVDGDVVKDGNGRPLMKLRDLDRIIDGPGGMSKAALWLLFVR